MTARSLKALIEPDCLEQNSLLSLSKIVTGVEGTMAPEACTVDSVPTASENMPANDGESQITAPQSINMYELAKQLKQNPEEIANDWANEYVHSEATSQTAQWSEEFDSFMKMKGVNSATEMDNTRQIGDAKMWPSEYLKQFEQSDVSVMKWVNDYVASLELSGGKENKQLESSSQKHGDSDELPVDLLEVYTFESNNPFLDDVEQYEKGQQAYKEGSLSNAILYLEAAVLNDANNFMAWILLGKCQSLNESDSLAIAALKKALRISPANQEARLALATACINEDLNTEAIALLFSWVETYEYAIDLNAATEEHFTSSSVGVEERLEQLERRVFDAMSHQEGRDAATFSNVLSLIYNMKGDYDRAVETLYQALHANPNDFILWNRLGATLANGKRAAEAVSAYQKAVELYPNCARIRHNIGLTCLSLKCYREAIEHFLSALQLQQYSNTVLSSLIWRSLRTAVSRTSLPNVKEILSAVNRHDLSACRNLIQILVPVYSSPLLPERSLISVFEKPGKTKQHVDYPSTPRYAVNLIEEWDYVTSQPRKFENEVDVQTSSLEVENKVVAVAYEESLRETHHRNAEFGGMPAAVEEVERESVLIRNEEEEGMESLNRSNDTRPRAENATNAAELPKFPVPTVSVARILDSSSQQTVTGTPAMGTSNASMRNDMTVESMPYVAIIPLNTTGDTEEVISFGDNDVDDGAQSIEIAETNAGETRIPPDAVKMSESFSKEKTSEDIGDVVTTVIKTSEGKSRDEIDEERKKIRSEKRLKLENELKPQVISRADFKKNGIEHLEMNVVPDCRTDVTAHKESESRHKPSVCVTHDENKQVPKATTDLYNYDKYSKEESTSEKEKAVYGSFERSIWEKLIAGLKCSHRDCGDALRPIRKKERLLREPSFSRARKHSVVNRF